MTQLGTVILGQLIITHSRHRHCWGFSFRLLFCSLNTQRSSSFFGSQTIAWCHCTDTEWTEAPWSLLMLCFVLFSPLDFTQTGRGKAEACRATEMKCQALSCWFGFVQSMQKWKRKKKGEVHYNMQTGFGAFVYKLATVPNSHCVERFLASNGGCKSCLKLQISWLWIEGHSTAGSCHESILIWLRWSLHQGP